MFVVSGRSASKPTAAPSNKVEALVRASIRWKKENPLRMRGKTLTDAYLVLDVEDTNTIILVTDGEVQ